MKNILCGWLIGCLAISSSRAPAQAQQSQAQETGCIYVASSPLETEIVGVQGDKTIFRKKTPALLCDLLANEIQIVFTKDDFEEHLATVHPKPGRVDTLFVTLTPRAYRKTRLTNWQTWLWSGIAAAGVVTIAVAVIFESGSEKGTTELQDLPAPPNRP